MVKQRITNLTNLNGKASVKSVARTDFHARANSRHSKRSEINIELGS